MNLGLFEVARLAFTLLNPFLDYNRQTIHSDWMKCNLEEAVPDSTLPIFQLYIKPCEFCSLFHFLTVAIYPISRCHDSLDLHFISTNDLVSDQMENKQSIHLIRIIKLD